MKNPFCRREQGAKRRRGSLGLLAALVLAPLLSLAPHSLLAQSAPPTFDATRLGEPMDLGGTWLIHLGDDPSFARPDYDDSHWTRFDPSKPIASVFPNARPELVWYRLRVRVDPTQTGLGLREWNLAHAYEIYVNGERLFASGQISPFVPYTYGARVLKAVPERMVATGTLLIAVRVRIARSEWRTGLSPGYFPTNLTLGKATSLYSDDWLAVIGENALLWLDGFLLVGIGIVALVLFFSERRQFEYFWIFALGAIRLGEFPVQAILLFHEIPYGVRLVGSALMIASPYVWVAMYFAFMQLKIGWKFGVYLVFAGLLNAYSNSGLEELVGTLPGAYELLVNLPFVSLLAFVIPILLIVHMRRGNREAGILLFPVIFLSLYIYAKYVLFFLSNIPDWYNAAQQGVNLIDSYPVGPLTVSLNHISGILSTISLGVIMLLRSSSMSRRQALLEGELEAAREVQQVILPEQIEAIPGFTVESAYQPAQQVGGDFFQVMPTKDGGLLLVLGDVAGKGLPAAMLVSVLVGATRTAAAYGHNPAEVLAQLNERLVGRSRGGFSTALAAHFSASGRVTIANAGHLSPYMDGRELDLPGALPLGILSGANYESKRFELAPGSRLTFYSDGVIEAQNAKYELLGFDRGRELSTRPAAEIIEAAMRFGQSDDITVVAVTRIASVAVAA